MIPFKVQNFIKRYLLGSKKEQVETLVGKNWDLTKILWQYHKRLRDLSRVGIENNFVF